jgi:hypothetical protein
MVPAVRAIADRFMYDTATLKYMASGLSDEALARATPHSGWTTRQVFAHLADNLQRYGDSLRRWLDDEPGFSLPGDPTEANAEAAAGNAARPIADVISVLDRGLREVVAQSKRIDGTRAEASIGPWPLMRVLAAWSGHARAHAVDLVSALPEFRRDPMVLNWALHFDFSNDPESAGWQRDLANEVRAMFKVQGEEN